MATAAPHVKLLRQLASAKDDYLSGAFDISWDGAKATLYLVFGRPSHAVFETGEASIEGEAAIDALLAALPRTFAVSDWRRAMSPHETLSITIDELAGPFVRLAGSYADDPVTDETPEWWSSGDDSPDLAFGLADFPLLPGGRPLWAETSPDEVHLAERLAELPPSILILTGAKLRAAAVVSGGDLIDAVWIDADDHARGETAAMAILGATKGSLAGYALDDPRVAEALTMLWRLPLAVSGVEMSWLDPASMLAAFRADGLDRVLVIDAPVRGIALFSRGGLVAVYSETQRSAVASPERLRSLLSQARGRLTVMERKPRPLASETAEKPLSAQDFFAVTQAEPAVEVAVAGDALEAEGVTAVGVTDGTDAQTAVEAAGSQPVQAVDAESEAFAPPPPPDAEAEADATVLPPPPPAAEHVEPVRKAKRSRWGFGRSRKLRTDSTAVPDAGSVAADASVAGDAADPASFAGWNIRQPNATPQPVWLRGRDPDDAAPAADPAAPGGDDAGETMTGWSPVPVESPRPIEGGTPVETSPPVEAAPAPADDEDALPSFAYDHNAAPAHEPAPEPVTEVWSNPNWLDDAITGESAPPEHEEPASFAEGALEPEADAPTDYGYEAEAEPHHEAVAETEPDHEAAAEAEPDHEAVAETEPDHEAAAEAEPDHEAAAEAEPDHEAVAEAEPDHEAVAEAEPDREAAAEAPTDHELEAETPVEPVASDDHEAGHETPNADDDSTKTAGAPRPAPTFRTPGPWSWPLAEPDERAHQVAGAPADASSVEPDAVEAGQFESVTVGAAEHDEEASPGEQSFFQRDEPVGSQFVDFDEVRNELVQIGVVWLGETNAVQVTALLAGTRSTIDDFVATIDTIRGLHLEGQDPASIQAMAREMHQQAAERLCGA